MMYKKILVPLDRSKTAECILPHLKQIAGGCRECEVILLGVIETPPAWVMDADADAIKLSHAAQIQNSKDYLSEIRSQLNLGEGGVVSTEVLIGVGHPAETIIEFAKKKKIDIILMTTNVTSAVGRLMIGSVADRVMRYSNLPVLMVRPAADKLS